mmetsp:Transcript_14015/g.39631  ORF Transcript_14015/g.39631 Transcript_14015/m.39631 type:complete len:82 (-) Transcript_14015:208-453(-)
MPEGKRRGARERSVEISPFQLFSSSELTTKPPCSFSVCDPKSLLYLFGMELDYSHELIGGGFKFTNPNAESTCGCGKSFSV